MTDNEIVKALEEFLYTLEDGYTTAIEFGGKRDEQIEKEIYLFRDTISIIKRQKAKLELSRKNNKAIMQTIADVRAEAIKEFAERLHCRCEEVINQEWNKKVSPVSWADAYEEFEEVIDNTLEEMVGDGG
jgi:hypothetical protein